MRREKKNLNKWVRFRIIVVGTCFCLMLIVLVGRSVQLQVFDGVQLAQKASDQYKKSNTQSPRRGTIYDRNYKELAVSIDVDSICAYPARIKSKNNTARTLAKILKTSQKRLLKKIDSSKSFVWIKRHAGPTEVSQIKALKLKGIDFIKESRRFYPNKSLAAQVIGFTGTDGCGLEGLEYACESMLKGETTTQTVLKDALGHIFSASKDNDIDRDGYNVVLTIDKNIQYIVENALSEGVKTANAKSGIAVVVAPKTGEVLAVAHVPIYNPNIFRKSEPHTWRNRAFSDSFEPGSTFKVFTAAAAIEARACTPNTIFYCENGAYRIGRNTIHDVHQFGWLSLQQIVKVSSNIGAAKVGEKIGPEDFYKSVKDFGFGEKTGINAPGEAEGTLLSYRKWSDIDAASISFGQGVSVSALQLAMALSAIANDGILMKPLLARKITDATGKVIERFKPTCVRQVVSKDTANTVTRILKTVITEGGTGVKASLTEYSVAGKTGTAQKANPKARGYLKGKYISSFVGFAPAEDPAIVVVVLIDEPAKESYGGIVAAPVFQKITRETLQYMKVLPRRELMVLNQTRKAG
ncbi:MAG: penicillin-binding protein 2 [Deltaproteobacteria bacterium]|nr:penicillin-binding protein 2 [Deltaproteobacteria bacterium]